MSKAALLRLLMLAALIGLLEVLCGLRVIDRLTMQPPHRMALDLWRMLASGALNAAIARTLLCAAVAFAFAVALGTLAALLLHRMPPVRAALDPLFATWYAIPVFAFYPLLIILFGLGDLPEIVIAFMLAAVAVVVSVLSGLDRVPAVLLKTARANRMGPLQTARRIVLPSVAPYVLTGARLALAYALIGVIGAEFIMSSSGMGYEISDAYNNFDNATMYPLILLIVVVSVAINAVMGRWERSMLRRRGLA